MTNIIKTENLNLWYGETEKMFHNSEDKRTKDYISGRFG